METLNLTLRTYQTAAHFAKEAARRQDGTVDNVKASTELARLLWHVRAADGGFKGLPDGWRARKWRTDPRLQLVSLETIDGFMWDAGEWPTAEIPQLLAAE